MSIVGEAMITASVEMLLKKLASEGLRLFARQRQIHDDLMKWKSMLVKIDAVLDDADEKQTNNKLVKIWLGELQNLAYDVEDLLDEFETDALRRKLLFEEPTAADQPSSSNTSMFRKLVPTCCTTFTPQSIKFDYAMMSKIKEINDRFERAVTEKDRLDLKAAGKPKKVRQRRETTSLVNEAKIYGREKEKRELVELLLRDDSSSDGGFSVITIKGMGGLGKTTLAQLIYNDDQVQHHFDLRAWNCVSEDFDISRVTRSILNSVANGHVGDNDDLNLLQEKLKKQLSGKKILLVLDDVWIQNYNNWIDLSSPFQAVAPGSKIVVTTRNQVVVDMMGTSPAYPLKELSNDDCLCVFTQHSFERRDFSMHQHLEEIGKKIVIKCDGLPLAAKALGGILRGKSDPSDWECVLNSKLWDLPEESCDILPALRVSYYYLSPPLKQCFAFCSLFPKDYEFEEEKIILLWIAVGFLDHQDSGKQREDLGRKYFHKLHSMSFFQKSSSPTSRFVMHDLVHDLAQWTAGEIYFRMEDALETNERQRFSKDARHLSYICERFDGVKRFDALTDIQCLRTFLPINLSGNRSYLACTILHKLFKLRCLRIISLRGYRNISELPNSIGGLKYLRHLDLSGSQIQTLPQSINTLYNLHTLMLEDCDRLRKLCADMGNLTKLHHLNNSNTYLLEEMPLGIGKLTCLQTLCNFVVGKDSGSGLRELKLLTHLQGTLNISRLENAKDVVDAKEVQLNDKKNLKVLLLRWTCNSTGDLMEPETEERVLDMLKPHKKLEQFYVDGYGGIKFPNWFGDSSFSNLVTLRFWDCGMCTSLPSVGQLPFLKHLEIRGMSRLNMVGSEFYSTDCPFPFPCLETLRFEDMQEWVEWINPDGSGQEFKGFLNLREIYLLNCPKLQGTLPENLPTLKKLIIKRCEQLLVSVTSLPTVCSFEIDGCRKVVWRSETDPGSQNLVDSRGLSNQVFLSGSLKLQLPELEEMKISNIEELTYMWQNETRLQQDISSLKRLEIGSCPKLQSMVVEEEQDRQHLGLSCRLESLELKDCQGLVKLPQASLSFSSLREIVIFNCSSLVSFPEAALPSRLRIIWIRDCCALESFPEAWMHDTNSSLENLFVHGCHSLTYIAGVQLPPSLKHLSIGSCNNLMTLTKDEGIQQDGSRRYTSLLQSIYIKDCRSLTSFFSNKELPAMLEKLSVYDCSKLTCLSFSGNLPQALKRLSVERCSKLESIAERLDNNTSLEYILISSCENLKILPGGLHKLSRLQYFEISSCGNLVSFPEGGLPFVKMMRLQITGCKKLEDLPNGMDNMTNLHSLCIDNTKIWKSLNRFTSLRLLEIRGFEEVVSFPPDEIGTTLPASLTELIIADCPNIECISSLGENITSLKLAIWDCPNIERISSLGENITSLQLISCPKLKYFPEIEERCRKDQGHLLTHIPCVLINFL